MKPKKLTRRIFATAFILAVIALAGSGAGRDPASACQSCFSESATAYQYCHANPTGVYEGCNFTHACSPYDTANSIYREECLLSSKSLKR
jgi:hypothetical protein